MDKSDLQESFARDGFVLLPDFYDVETTIRPIQEGVRDIIEIVSTDAGIKVECDTPEIAMSRGFTQLIAHDRKLGANVYDAVKQLSSFVRCASSQQNEDLYRLLRPGVIPGLAGGGSGIRIDNPNEDHYRAYWHQEFPAQLRSLDGAVFWSPLVPVERAMGPVEIARGSHKEGLIPVYVDEGFSSRKGAYSLRMKNEESLIAKYEKLAPLTKPGDLVVMDFLTLHQSGENIADRSRWSMQFRYFNFSEPMGRRVNWAGAFAAGKSISQIFSEVEELN